MSRKNKTISFNSLDQHELALLKHAEKINPLTGRERNFSKYVKQLIEEDMRRERIGYSNQKTVVSHYEEEEISVDVKNKMNSFL